MTRIFAGALIPLSLAIAIPGALRYPELFHKTPLQGWRMLWSMQQPAAGL
jgi:hypothetical protein